MSRERSNQIVQGASDGSISISSNVDRPGLYSGELKFKKGHSGIKFSGGIIAIMGFFILAFLGFAYAWDQARNFPYDMADYTIYAVTGSIMLIAGMMVYIFIDE